MRSPLTAVRDPGNARLLSTGSTVLSRFGTIDQPGQIATVDLPLPDTRVEAPPSGATVYDVHVAADAGSSLVPGAVRLSNSAGASVVFAVPASGDVLVALRPGDYSLSVRGRGASTGAFVVSTQLEGDVNGDGAVTFSDVAQIAEALPTAGRPAGRSGSRRATWVRPTSAPRSPSRS